MLALNGKLTWIFVLDMHVLLKVYHVWKDLFIPALSIICGIMLA